MASDDARGVEAATAAIASPLEPRLQVAGGLLDDVPGVGGVMFDDLTGKLSAEGAAEGLTGAAPRGRPIALPICTAWRAAEVERQKGGTHNVGYSGYQFKLLS